MKKHEYLKELERRLKGMPPEERASTLAFYTEMLEERIEEGMGEEEAVAQMERPEEIAARLVSEQPREGRGINWLLLVCGLPLLLAAAGVVLSVLICLWAVVVSLWSVAVAGIAAGGITIVASPVLFGKVVASGFVTLGGGLALLGAGILLIYPCKWASKGCAWLSAGTLRLCGRMLKGGK